MPRTTRRTSRSKSKSSEPSYGWQNVALFPRDNGKLSGYLNITPEFLDEIADRIDNGTLKYDSKRNTYALGITVRENENVRNDNDAEFLGNVYLFDEEEEKPVSRSRRRRPQEDEDEEDEPPRRTRRSRRDEDEEDDEPPRRKSKSRARVR